MHNTETCIGNPVKELQDKLSWYGVKSIQVQIQDALGPWGKRWAPKPFNISFKLWKDNIST